MSKEFIKIQMKMINLKKEKKISIRMISDDLGIAKNTVRSLFELKGTVHNLDKLYKYLQNK